MWPNLATSQKLEKEGTFPEMEVLKWNVGEIIP
jgi:hypothetical protein